MENDEIMLIYDIFVYMATSDKITPDTLIRYESLQNYKLIIKSNNFKSTRNYKLIVKSNNFCSYWCWPDKIQKFIGWIN